MKFCITCCRMYTGDELYCAECTDWINQDWIDDVYDPNPVLLCRFSDGGVVCAYQNLCAIILDEDLPNYCPYDWLANQLEHNTMLNGIRLDPNREYAFQIDGLVDAILLDALAREGRLTVPLLV